MSLATVKSLYEGVQCRISEWKYPPGALFAGARTKQCKWYVRQGACVLTTHGEHELSAGDVVDIDAGDYALRVTGGEELKLIMVWEFHPGMV
jgi:hypothetical protein